MAIAKREPHRIALVDARQPAEIVHPLIVEIVRERLLQPNRAVRPSQRIISEAGSEL
jgi:hypothetical protein